MNRFVACAGALALVFCSYQSASAVGIISTFDAGLDGWTVSGGNAAFVTPGGNPGGYLEATDSSGSVMTANAPGAFLGNKSSFDGGSIGFDSKLFKSSGATQPQFGLITISNGLITGSADLAAANLPDWTSYTAALTAATFGLSQSDFTALLASITSVTLALESTFPQGEIVGLDNFFIEGQGTGPVVPEPSSLALLAMGLSGAAGFRFMRRKNVQSA